MIPLQEILFVLILVLTSDPGNGHPCPPNNGTGNGTNPCFPDMPGYGDPRFPYAFPPPPHQPYPNYPQNYQNPNYGYQPQPQVHWPQQPPQRPGYSYPPNYSGPSQYYPRLPFYGYPLPHYSFQRRTGPVPSRVAEPVFMDRGTVQIINGRDAELTCSFTDPKYKVISNIVWVKVTGPYDHFMAVPPFDCLTPGCQYEHINSAADFRFRVITLGSTSILHIYDFMHRDFGIYRCAATGTGSDGQTVTLYKIVEFLQPSPSQHHQRPFK